MTFTWPHDPRVLCDATKAAAFAKTVDVVVLCLGGDVGGEARDWAAVLPGDQAALGPPVWRVLRTRLGVGFECFASPLNGAPPCIEHATTSSRC